MVDQNTEYTDNAERVKIFDIVIFKGQIAWIYADIYAKQ